MSMVSKRCPNADIIVETEGKGIFKTGYYVVKCRATGHSIANNVAYETCLSRGGGSFGGACNLCKGGDGGGLIPERDAGWKRCRYSQNTYGW